jgi:hypothetical protein
MEKIMKKILLVLVLLVPFQALADRDYTSGKYWTVTSVETKPGMYEDYLSDLKLVAGVAQICRNDETRWKAIELQDVLQRIDPCRRI